MLLQFLEIKVPVQKIKFYIDSMFLSCHVRNVRVIPRNSNNFRLWFYSDMLMLHGKKIQSGTLYR